MNLNIKKCKKCGRMYDYPRCPYCNWTDEEKKIEEKKNGARTN